MRMSLGLSGQYLAYRFKVHSSTISRTFLHVLGILYVKLKPLIIWPDRDNLRKTMPVDFRKHFPNCVVIIDCFDFFWSVRHVYWLGLRRIQHIGVTTMPM